MSKLLAQILRVLLVLLMPLVIVLGVVRLVAIEPYLAFEYNKTDFPADPFGFARGQRLDHAAANLQFVTQNQPMADLAEQEHNNAPLYNAREISHMQVVQNIYQTAMRAWQVALFLAVLSGLPLAWRKEDRSSLASALQTGGALTFGLVVVAGLAAIAAWQSWFVVFHQVFFAAGSWTFDFTDTLIRLFPEKFWYDTALTISSLSLIGGFLVYWFGSRIRTTNNRESGWNGNEDRQALEPATYQHGS